MAVNGPGTIFVVGCPRSGTTLVGELFGSSNRVYNARESFLIDRVHSWQQMLVLTSPLAKAFVNRAEALVQELILSASTDPGKTHLVDHTPWHALYVEDIWRLFSRAQIVHVVRHPASVVASLERSYAAGYAWAGSTIHDRIMLWKRFVNSMAKHPESDLVRHIRYEDLCAKPVQVAQSLFHWVSLPWENEFLDAFARPHAPNPGKPFTLATTRGAQKRFRSPPPIPRTEAVLAALREAVAEELATFNYHLGDA